MTLVEGLVHRGGDGAWVCFQKKQQGVRFEQPLRVLNLNSSQVRGTDDEGAVEEVGWGETIINDNKINASGQFRGLGELDAVKDSVGVGSLKFGNRKRGVRKRVIDGGIVGVPLYILQSVKMYGTYQHMMIIA